MSVAGVLLAAGGGRRFGGPKAGVLFNGRSLAQRGVATLLEGGCDPVVVVTGAGRDGLTFDAAAIVSVVVNQRWPEGLSTSLRAGIAAVEPTVAEAAVIALADQPLVTPAAVARLIAAWNDGAVAASATYDGKRRNPVLIDRSVWADVVESALGDDGARRWLRAHADMVVAVPCDGVAAAEDIDTPDDLARLSSHPLAAT